MSNQDHWGELASNLGAEPIDEESSSENPLEEAEDIVSSDVSAEVDTAADEDTLDPTAEEQAASAQDTEPAGLEIEVVEEVVVEQTVVEVTATQDDADGEPGWEPEAADQDNAPPTDFLEAVRREQERSEAVLGFEWPSPDALAAEAAATDTGDAPGPESDWANRVPFRETPQPPDDFGTDSTDDLSHESDLSSGDDAAVDSSDTEVAEDSTEESEEQPTRRRRRRRGRRGGRGRGESKDQAKDVAAQESDGDTAVATVAAESDQAAASESEAPTEPKGDKTKHRSIPTWPEAIRMIVDSNLEARSKSPNASRSRGRGRGGRRRGRGSK